MGELVDLPSPRSRWFADARGRSLKVTRHPEAALLVFSLWEADRCIGTFRLPAEEAPRLMLMLAEAVDAWVARPQPSAASDES